MLGRHSCNHRNMNGNGAKRGSNVSATNNNAGHHKNGTTQGNLGHGVSANGTQVKTFTVQSTEEDVRLSSKLLDY